MGLTIVTPGVAEIFATTWSHDGDLACALIDEVCAQASEDQALGFFAAVGARLAATHTLPADLSLARLEQSINVVWRAIGLGQAALTMQPDGISIDHIGHSDADRALPPSWHQAVAAMLRGAYGAWFQLLGGPTLQTRIVSQTSDRIMMHHGH